jgi:hypothetical protein
VVRIVDVPLEVRSGHRLFSRLNILVAVASPVKGEWRKLHNEELKGLYSSPNIVRVIKSRRMRWAGNVGRMGEGRGVYRVLVETRGEDTAGETQA